MKASYAYTVLRYVHDTTTGEFVNVGVLLYSQKERFVRAQCRTTYGRLAKVFPGIDGDAFKSVMRRISNAFGEIGQRMAEEPLFEIPATVMDLALKVFPRDDSSLQWSVPGSGVTEDLVSTFDRIYQRMVFSYEDDSGHIGKSDEQVWSSFKKNLEKRNQAIHFKPKKITVSDDEIEFEHTIKNGVLHCLKPISFDLSADGITDKAHKWLGQFTSVSAALSGCKVYLLVGEPQQRSLHHRLSKAISILEKIPVDKEIVYERDASAFSERFVRSIESSLKGDH